MLNAIGIEITDRLSIPKTKFTDAAMVILGSILIAVSAQLVIRLPFSPIPITGQTFAVLLVGFVLGWKRGLLSLTAYLLEGVAGLPVFAGGGAGLAWLLGPTGGYLLGFVVSAGLVGLLAEKGMDRKISTTLLVFSAGQIVIYLVGASWLAVYTGWELAIQTGVLPFLIGDLLKAFMAAVALPFAWKLLR